MDKLKQQQAAFAAHLRHPQLSPPPVNIEDRRLDIYRQLFFNNIKQFISSAFPVLCSLHEERQWNELIRDFYTNHKAQSPYFLEISEEFLAWLKNPALLIHQQYPFAAELAHYEWVELALDVADSFMPNVTNVEGSILTNTLALSDVAWPLLYSWPVHLIGKDFQPQQANEMPTCLVVYRNVDDKVCFLESNITTLRLLEIIQDQPNNTGLMSLQQLALEMPHTQANNIIQFGQNALEQLLQLSIIVIRV